MATNGQITKKIYAELKSKRGEDLRKAVTPLLNSFPLSSHKLVYDSDAGKYDSEAWAVLIECCIATDEVKLRKLNEYLLDNRLGPKKAEFGRFFPD